MSNEKQHTPGPWRVFSYANTIEVESPDDLNLPPVVGWPGFDDCERSTKEHLANARLIAAAPDMLEACEYNDQSLFSRDQNMLDGIADILETRGILLGVATALREKAELEKAAIAKARGE